MMEQLSLCVVWTMENWLGTSMNHIQGWMTLRMLLTCFRKRTSAPPLSFSSALTHRSLTLSLSLSLSLFFPFRYFPNAKTDSRSDGSPHCCFEGSGFVKIDLEFPLSLTESFFPRHPNRIRAAPSSIRPIVNGKDSVSDVFLCIYTRVTRLLL